jgi:hypothetical protein
MLLPKFHFHTVFCILHLTLVLNKAGTGAEADCTDSLGRMLLSLSLSPGLCRLLIHSKQVLDTRH